MSIIERVSYGNGGEDSKALLPDLERVLGADHPSTLTTRNNIAAWTGETGAWTRQSGCEMPELPSAGEN
jgi:hypothetical protein